MYCMLKQSYIQRLSNGWNAFCINVRRDLDDVYRRAEKLLRDEAWTDKNAQTYSVESIDNWLNTSLTNLYQWYNNYLNDVKQKEASVNLLLNQLYTTRLHQGTKYVFHFWDERIEEQPHKETTAFAVAGMFFNGHFGEAKFETHFDPPVITVEDYTEWLE